MQKIFSVPLNPKLNPEQFQEFFEFLKQNKHLIYDVYFTSRIPPFAQDAMGDIFLHNEDYAYAINTALYIQKEIGIPISATFNNTTVPPTQSNLDTLIRNFKPLYDAGVKTVTIPHTHWMATGQIKKAFPEIHVKNTILRDVSTPSEIVNLAKAGFDYINLDRDLMRNRDVLLRLLEAKVWIKKNLGKDIKYSLLANEGCLGNCPMMVEHFEFNNTRQDPTPQYFNDPISRVSCPKWDVLDPSVHLKTADLPPWREDWEEFINDLGIDVFKMHGREAIPRLYETMEIIRKWDNGDEILVAGFETYLEETNLKDKPINIWRDKIKNCKFDCWECQYCDKIYKAKSDLDHSDIIKHVATVIADSGVPKLKVDVPGLTSPRVQTVLNGIAKGVGSYLEIGSYLGATLCSVIKDNPINAIAVDNWIEQIQPQTGKDLPANNFEAFKANVEKYQPSSGDLTVINADMLSVDTTPWTKQIQMFFYDGPHDAESTASAVKHYWNTFSNEVVLIFDDANWAGVVEGAREAINECEGLVTYEKILLNSEENPNEWWNGLYILVVRT
ncbi:MAG: class I SAM-dependent methyltransferase [Methylophagaceae bacterium]